MCLTNDFSYWAAQRKDSLTAIIPRYGNDRSDLMKYVNTVSHKRDKPFVGFPYTKDVIEPISKLAIFQANYNFHL